VVDSDEATPDQWRAIRSRRGKTALAAKALWDVVRDLGPDGRTDAGDYIKFYRIAQSAFRHFRDGTKPTYAEQRSETYKKFQAILSAIAAIALETAKTEYLRRSHQPHTERGATSAMTPKRQSPQAAAKLVRLGPRHIKVAAESNAMARIKCMSCYSPLRSDGTCPKCEREEKRDGRCLAAVVELLSDGRYCDWESLVGVAKLVAAPCHFDEEWFEDLVRDDSRFVEKDGKWAMKRAAMPTPAAKSAGAKDARSPHLFARDADDNSPDPPDLDDGIERASLKRAKRRRRKSA